MNMQEREFITNLIGSYLNAQGIDAGEVTARDIVQFANIDGITSSKVSCVLMREYNRINHQSFIEGYRVVGIGKKDRPSNNPGKMRTFRVKKDTGIKRNRHLR